MVASLISESLELRIARSRIESYEHDADEAIVRASNQAQDCLDCEAFLNKGIQALEWLERYEQALVEATTEGIVEMTPDLEDGLEVLHSAWLRPCDFAEKWIAKCVQNGFEVKKLAMFRDCCERAREWLDRNDSYKKSKALREECFSQEPW